MASSAAARRVCVEQYLVAPRYERCEYTDGKVVELNQGGAREAAIRPNLCGALAAHLRERGSGRLFPRRHCRLRVSRVERFHVPDVSAAAAGGRFPLPRPAPLDPRQAWVVLPEQKTVLACVPDAPAHPASSGEALDGGTLIPGLRVPIDDLFD